jgi:hypothetical protein
MDDVNVSTDLALCRGCGKTYSFSEIVRGSATDGPDLAAPPTGAWFEQFPRGSASEHPLDHGWHSSLSRLRACGRECP